VDEAGVPGAYFSTWYSLWAPKGTPKDIVARLGAAVATVQFPTANEPSNVGRPTTTKVLENIVRRGLNYKFK
jgi:hypothetical protein